jgi:hypothetical protein
MKKNKKEKNIKNDFVPSYFEWVTMDEQRKIVERLEKITKNNNL